MMSPGYVGQVRTKLSQSGRPITHLKNISVGANTCLMGLENIRKVTKLENFDKIIIEFAINDLSLATPDAYETWQCAYEGILRYILRKAPSIQVYNLILGRRAERKRHATELIRRGIEELSKYYGNIGNISIIDFDLELRSFTNNNHDEYVNYYKDDAHYNLDRGVPMLASFVANCLILDRYIVSGNMPRPLRACSFDRAKILQLPKVADGMAMREFENSRFNRSAVILETDKKFILKIQGPLVYISYLATFDARPLLVEEEGERPVMLLTSHPDLEDKEGKFLIKSFAFEWKEWSAIKNRGPRYVKLSAVDPDAIPSLSPYLVERYNAVRGVGSGSGPYVSTLMYLPPPKKDTGSKLKEC